MEKRLININIRDILRIFAKANCAITSTDLVNILDQHGKLKKSKNYVYERLKYLYPEDIEFNKRTIILDLKKLKKNPSENYVVILINKLLKIFSIRETLLTSNFKEKSNNNKKLKWSHGLDDQGNRLQSLQLNDWKVTYYLSFSKIIIRNCLTFNQFTIEWNSIEQKYHDSGLIHFHNDYHNISLLPIEKKIRLKHTHQNNVHIHLQKTNRGSKTRFLDVYLKEKIGIRDPELRMRYKSLISESKLLEEVKKRFNFNYRYPLTGTTDKIRNKLYDLINNSRYWKYQINIKGLLLYLYLENMDIEPTENYYGKKYGFNTNSDNRIMKLRENQKTEDSIKKLRLMKKKKKDIRDLLSASLVQKMCPFLIFDSAFRKVGFKSEQILLNLSKEFVPQIDFYDKGVFKMYSGFPIFTHEVYLDLYDWLKVQQDSFLIWKIWERYYYEIEKHFLDTFHDVDVIRDLFRDNKIDTYEKLMEYRLLTSKFFQKMINLEMVSIRTLYSKAYNECKKSKYIDLGKYTSPSKFRESFN
ncbi:MAG: hypothetical protein AB7V56_06795 [Candidatus Nitrosocosmicus sp.]